MLRPLHIAGAPAGKGPKGMTKGGGGEWQQVRRVATKAIKLWMQRGEEIGMYRIKENGAEHEIYSSLYQEMSYRT